MAGLATRRDRSTVVWTACRLGLLSALQVGCSASSWTRKTPARPAGRRAGCAITSTVRSLICQSSDTRPDPGAHDGAALRRPQSGVPRDRIRVVTMDGFTGYRTATTESLDKARAVMDPFHVVHPAAEKLTPLCSQRVQQDTGGYRGRSGNPLYGIRPTLLTRIGLLTDKQKTRLRTSLDARDEHVVVSVTYAIYQDLIDTYGPAEQTGREDRDVQTAQTHPHQPTRLSRRGGSTRSFVVGSARGDPGLLRHRRIQRPG